MLEEIVAGEGETAELGALIARCCGAEVAQDVKGQSAVDPSDRPTLPRTPAATLAQSNGDVEIDFRDGSEQLSTRSSSATSA